MFKKIFSDFRKVERPILYLIAAVFFIQLIDGAFFILFNFYLRTLGYNDAAIADLTAHRFLAIMLLAFPLGLFIKGRKLKPFLLFASLAVPTIAFLLITTLSWHWTTIASYLMIVLGVANTCLSVTAMPFIILNLNKESQSEGIAMYFQTFSITAFISGLVNYILNSLNPGLFNEKLVLEIFILLGFIGFLFIRKIKIVEHVSERIPLQDIWSSYDWKKIGEVMMPTLLIAIGAGLTIPFVNLFFESVHGINSKDFSLASSISFVFVAIMIFFIPSIRRRFGYRMVISLFQFLGVIALIAMATTQFYSSYQFAGLIAVIAFLLRQPFMNVAGPATSELSLNYVGERNQEMIGALNASIWSGSWFISSRIFGSLRQADVPYVYIFLATACLYLIAILWYMRLINRFERKTELAVATI